MNHQDIVRAVERLKAGGLVAFPTETVYGLGADARSEAAVARVFAAKGRPSNNPLIVHVPGLLMAEQLGVLDDRARALTRAFWPGPLSIVVPRAAGSGLAGGVTGGVRGGGATVALRSPDHPVALALLFSFGGPLVGPSANKSGGVSPTLAAHVREAFDEREVLTLDGGACAAGIESTVVWLGEAGGRARVLRPGVIGAAALGAVLGEEVDGPGLPGGAGVGVGVGGVLLSPGLLASHYAPRARCVVVEDLAGVDDLVGMEELAGAGGLVVVLSHSLVAEDELARLDLEGVELIEMPHEAWAYAGALYARLREADARGPLAIVVHRPPSAGETAEETAVWQAIMDRLARASAAR